MTERKSISLEKEYLDMIQPIVEKYRDNFSAAIKEVISFANFMIEKYGSLENARQLEDKRFRDEFVGEHRGIIIPMPVLRWLIRNSKGLIPAVEIVEESIDPLEFVSLTEDEKNIRDKVRESGWPLEISVEVGDEKQELLVKIRGLDPLFNEFAAAVGSLFLANKLGFKVVKFKKMDTLVEVTYEGSESKEEAYESVSQTFGRHQVIFDEISRKPEFWRDLIELYKATDYNLVVLDKREYEHLLSGEEEVCSIEACEKEFGKPIVEISFLDALDWLKKTCKLTGKIDDIVYKDGEIKVYHGFMNDKAIEKLERQYCNILEILGKTEYSATRAYGMLIFKPKDKEIV
jgi:hypothetical protein